MYRERESVSATSLCNLGIGLTSDVLGICLGRKLLGKYDRCGGVGLVGHPSDQSRKSLAGAGRRAVDKGLKQQLYLRLFGTP